MYALGTLRNHGLTGKALHNAARATMIAKLIYTSPAWWVTPKGDRDASHIANNAVAKLCRAIRYNPQLVFISP